MQKIYYGAPGTGKSFEINKYLEEKNIPDERIFRITFHPEYNYNDFTGQLLPTVVRTGEHAGDITYEYEKGVFTLALEKAYEDTSKEVYLVLEEMSRGNCAAIFGDIFQLLDRIKDGVNRGYSRYFINNAVISKDIIAIDDDRVKLPPNLSILGTVNTSDQNVFVMDTAFKRRFEWEYISTKAVKDEHDHYLNNIVITLNDGSGTPLEIQWVNLYSKLNTFISSDDKLGLGEDKQIGQFFIEFDTEADWDAHKEQIKNKLLHFLWFDINQSSYRADVRLFDESIKNFSDLYDTFADDGKIFSNAFFECINE